jgi:hypothetical protein
MKYLIFFLLSFAHFQTLSQTLLAQFQTPMPHKVANTAVCEAWQNGVAQVYSFGGIDSTKMWTGIHQKCVAYNVTTQLWRILPNIPDSLGKIASAASLINDTIYVVGGYHVLSNGNEISSHKVHRFVPTIDSFVGDATPLPYAIDDHVQAVWRDSLLFVISGWSNIGNVVNVQIFNPLTQTWALGTNLPNTNDYKAFGASGCIVNDTIYYFGGAKMGTSFPATSFLRKGIINPNNPTQITWSMTDLVPIKGYRMAAVASGNYVMFVGGSEVSYNYDGIAYNGSGAVIPKQKMIWYNINTQTWFETQIVNINMDYRGIAKTSDSTFYVLGGIDVVNQVSNNCIKLLFNALPTHLARLEVTHSVDMYPNPAKDKIFIRSQQIIKTIELLDMWGNIILCNNRNLVIDINGLSNTTYFLKISFQDGAHIIKKVIKNG